MTLTEVAAPEISAGARTMSATIRPPSVEEMNAATTAVGSAAGPSGVAASEPSARTTERLSSAIVAAFARPLVTVRRSIEPDPRRANHFTEHDQVPFHLLHETFGRARDDFDSGSEEF